MTTKNDAAESPRTEPSARTDRTGRTRVHVPIGLVHQRVMVPSTPHALDEHGEPESPTPKRIDGIADDESIGSVAAPAADARESARADADDAARAADDAAREGQKVRHATRRARRSSTSRADRDRA